MFDTLSTLLAIVGPAIVVIGGLRSLASGQATVKKYDSDDEGMPRGRPYEETSYFGWRALCLGVLQIAAGVVLFIYLHKN